VSGVKIRSRVRHLPSFAVTIGLGCASPSPIRYVANERPHVVRIASPELRSEEARVEATKPRFGILYRGPLDVPALIDELQQANDAVLLTNVNLRAQTPFRYTLS
jgi:hypothetical protein